VSGIDRVSGQGGSDFAGPANPKRRAIGATHGRPTKSSPCARYADCSIGVVQARQTSQANDIDAIGLRPGGMVNMGVMQAANDMAAPMIAKRRGEEH
jgi:hypothetical protein